jgi:hypothetical protein
MRANRVWVVAVGLGIASFVRAGETPPTTTTDVLIKQLSADTWKERQTAQEKLVGMGDDAVPVLKELVNKSEDEEIRTRAGAALRQIEENGRTGPSFVTIKVKDASPEEVFAQIARQSRCELPTMPKNLWKMGGFNAPRLTMEMERVPFWTAFKEACNQAGVYPQMGNERQLTLHRGNSSQWNGPTVVSGPFMIVANRVFRSNSVELATPQNVQHQFEVSLSAFAEPKIKVLQSGYEVKLEEAVDDAGNSLVPDGAFGDGISSGQQWMWSMTARLKYPDAPGKTIKRLKGSSRFVVQAKSERLDVPEVLSTKNLTKIVAGRRILLKEVKKNGDQYEVSMTIYRDALTQAQWNAVQNPGYSVKLLDKEGRALSSHGWGGGGGGSEMSFTWNFSRNRFGAAGEDAPGEAYRLVWDIPVETREMSVSFEFKDLPLP